MNYSLRTVSQIPDSSVVSKTISDFNMSGRQNTYVSSRRLDMERNMRSNMTVAASRARPKVVFVRVAEFLAGPECSQFEQNLFQEYGEYLHFEYFSDPAGIARVNFSAEPVSCIIIGYAQRTWAKKFSQNELRHHNLTIYLMCHDRPESEYPDIMKNYSNDMLKPVAGYPDTEQLIRVEYELYSAQYINQVTEKRIRSKFYFKTSSNAVLNIYYEEQLGKMVTPYVNPISSSRRFRKTNFFRYRDLKELMLLAKGRKNMKRTHTKKMVSALNINDSSQSLNESRMDLTANMPAESIGDILRTSETEDINYILVTGTHPQLDQIRKYCISQKNTRMLLLDSEKSIREMKEQMNIFANSTSSTDENSQRDRIVMSQRLLVMVHYNDELTRAEIEQQQNFNFHTELVLFVTAEQLATAIWRVHENQNYFGLVILEENKVPEFQQAIEQAVGFGTPRHIDNIKMLLKVSQSDQDGILSQHYLEEVNPEKSYLTTPIQLADVNQHSLLIHQIFEARNIFYHPARGIIGSKVIIYVRKNRSQIFELLRDAVNRNKRLGLMGYEDKQQLEYLVQKTNKSECSLIVTDEREFVEVMRVIKGIENVYVLLISAKERLSFDPQVLKTGLEEDINTFVSEIPDNQQDDDDCSYLESDEDSDQLQVLRRFSSRSDNMRVVALPGRALLTVRIANNQQSKNSILFENRIRKHFKEQVNFRFYENTEQIRDMDKSQQPLQFLIVNDAYLEWTKRMATIEAKQKFEIIYYTQQPLQPFRELVEKYRYVRFKLVARHWRSIEHYILGRASKYSKYQITFKVTTEQRVHIVMHTRNRIVEETLAKLAVHENNEIAKRCIYYYHDMKNLSELQKLLMSVTRGELCFVIVDQKERNREFEIGNMLARMHTNYQQIILSVQEDRFAEHERTACVVFNQEEAAEYISSFELVDHPGQILASSGSVMHAEADNSAFKSLQNSRSQEHNNQEHDQLKESVEISHQVNSPVAITIPEVAIVKSEPIMILQHQQQQKQGPPASNLQIRPSKTYISEPDSSMPNSRPDEPCLPCPKPQLPKIARIEKRPSGEKPIQPPIDKSPRNHPSGMRRPDAQPIITQPQVMQPPVSQMAAAQVLLVGSSPSQLSNLNDVKQSSSSLSSKPKPPAVGKPPLPVHSGKPSQISQNSRKSSRPLALESSRSSSEDVTNSKPVIAIYYLANSPSIERIVEYISNNSTSAQVLNYQLRSLQEVEKSLSSNKTDRALLLISGSPRELEKASKLQFAYPQLRVYKNPTGDALTELSVVFQLGWEYKLLTLPYCNPALPADMLSASRIKMFLPRELITSSSSSNGSSSFVFKEGYTSPVDLCQAVESLPISDYVIALVHQQHLADTWNLPFRNPNCRLMVLAKSLAIRQWFEWYGDVFWLYADSDPKAVLEQLSKLSSDLLKLRVAPPIKPPISHVLYYKKGQSAINSLELLSYRKRLYDTQVDLKSRSVSKPAQELSYLLLTDSNEALVKPLSTVTFIKTTSHWSSEGRREAGMIVPYLQVSDIKEFIQEHQLHRYSTPIIVAGYEQQDEIELIRLQAQNPSIQLRKAPSVRDSSQQSRVSKTEIGIGPTPPSSTTLLNPPQVTNSSRQSTNVQRIPARVIEPQRYLSPDTPTKLLVKPSSIILPSPPTPPIQSEMKHESRVVYEEPARVQPRMSPQQVHIVIQPQLLTPSKVQTIAAADAAQQTSYVQPVVRSQAVSVMGQSTSTLPLPICQMINHAINTNDTAGLGIYYLCEWLPLRTDRFMKHVNINELLEVFQQKPNQLMIVFAEKDMLNRLPKNFKTSDQVRIVVVADEQCPESQHWLRATELQDVENHIKRTIDAKTQTESKSQPSVAVGTEGKQEFDLLITNHGPFSTEASKRVIRSDVATIGKIMHVDREQLLDKVAYMRGNNPLILVLDSVAQYSEPIQVIYDEDAKAKLSVLQPNARVLRNVQELKHFLVDNPNPRLRSPDQPNRKKILNTVDLKLSRDPSSSQLQQKSSLRRPSSKVQLRVTSPAETGRSSKIVVSNNERILELPSALEGADMLWIEDAIPRFLPILNGDIMRVLIPFFSTELRDLLSKCLPTLIVVKYTDIDYINTYLSTHTSYPTLVLLTEQLTDRAEQLQYMHSNLRIVQMGQRFHEPLGVTLNIQNSDNMEYLTRRLVQENTLVDLMSNKYSEQLPTEISPPHAGLLPVTSADEKIYVLYDPKKNRLVMDSVGRATGDNVLFVPYRTVTQASEHISKLEPEDIALLIGNDSDIRPLEAIPSGSPHLYYIRHISHHMRTSTGFGLVGEKVLFTGYTLQSISNFISSLLTKSFGKVGKVRFGRIQRPQFIRVKSSETSRFTKPADEAKRYRRRYAPSSFGTAARFEYYDQKYVPTQGETTRDRVSSSQSRYQPSRQIFTARQRQQNPLRSSNSPQGLLHTEYR